MSQGRDGNFRILPRLVRTVLGAGVPALLLLLAAIPYCAFQLDGKLRSIVQSRLGEKFPNAHVQVGEARYVAGQGIRLRGITIREAGELGDRALLASVDELWLLTSKELAELALGRATWDRIVLVRPKVLLRQTAEGSWNVDALTPAPGRDEPMPVWQIVDGTVELSNAMLVSGRERIVLRGVNGQGMAQVGKSGAMEHKITMQCHGDDLDSATIKLIAQPSKSVWNMEAAWQGLHFHTAWMHWLPHSARVHLINSDVNITSYGQLNVQCVGKNAPLRWRAQGDCQDGSLDDVRLPLPLANAKGEFSCSHEGLLLRRFSARQGRTTLYFDYEQKGWGAERDCKFEAVARDFECHQDLYGYLPSEFPALRTWWARLTPEGDAHIRVGGRFQNGQFRPALDVELADAAITYEGFPYRVRNAKGTISYRDDRLSGDVTAYAGSRPVRLTMDINKPGKNATGYIALEGEQLAIDGKVIEALESLPSQAAQQVRRLRPRGAFDMHYRWSKESPSQANADREMLLTFSDCQINHELFPYPLSNVRGQVLQRNHVWSLGPSRPLEGTGGDGQVQCQGSLVADAVGSAKLDLFFTGRSIPLNGALRDALDVRGQTLWNDLRPEGKIHFAAHFQHATGAPSSDIEVQVTPDRETVSIHPIHFPYRMERIQGEFEVRRGEVTWKQIRAAHKDTLLTTGGALSAAVGQPWLLQLRDLHVDWNDQDQDFVEALPAPLRKAAAAVSPKGRFHLAGDLTLEGAHGAHENALAQDVPPNASWNLRVDCVNGSLNCGAPIHSIFGAMRDIIGESRNGAFFTRGELECDSMMLFGHAITGVRGPIRATQQGLTLGGGATLSAESVHHRNIVGAAYGGALVASGEIPWREQGNYAIRATLADADLAQFAREFLPGNQQLGGRLDATAHIMGVRNSKQSLRGEGSIRLRDADIYELPIMVSMLKLLSLSPATTSAFDEGNIEYRIMGDYLELPRIDFLGNVFSLKGKGQVKFTKELDLLFAARLGRREIPLLSRISESASERLMPVHVGGTLLEPETSIGSFNGLAEGTSSSQPNNWPKGPLARVNRTRQR